MDLTHASFFSGVGGVDLGLERAGWRTVSVSEIDPYANAVLAHHWPEAPNLGDIVAVAEREGHHGGLGSDPADQPEPQRRRRSRRADGPVTDTEGGTQEQSSGRDIRYGSRHPDWRDATLWSGGFPCQDLSVAGRRAGFAGDRSSLAFAFLRLVGIHRPRAILLENVPGLLSSHGGRDLGALLGAMVELGYGVAWRELDAKHFGVPQRRRRIFLLGLRCDPDDLDGHLAALGAAEVLAVGTRCDRHPPSGGTKGKDPANGTGGRAPLAGGIANTLTGDGRTIDRADGPINYVVGATPDAGGVRATDGLAGRLDDRAGLVRTFTKSRRPHGTEDHETWVEGDATPTLNVFDSSAVRATTIIAQSLDQKNGGVDDNEAQAGHLAIGGLVEEEDLLLPPGLDSNRYRCCGNGVVAPVAEWIGNRLAAYLKRSPWVVVPKGDKAAVRLADGHYSRRKVGSPQFMPPGQTLVLVTPDEKAVFGWWRPHPTSGITAMNGLDGWTCTIFRNTGPHRSSDLILAAEQELLSRFDVGPDGMLTYVWDAKVASKNPGYCFKVAGWKRIGRSQDGRKTLLQKEVNRD